MPRTKDLKSMAELARQAKIGQPHICDLIKGRRNASLDTAFNLGFLTNTDPRLWGHSGTAEDRQVAYEAWRAAQILTRPPCKAPGCLEDIAGGEVM